MWKWGRKTAEGTYLYSVLTPSGWHPDKVVKASRHHGTHIGKSMGRKGNWISDRGMEDLMRILFSAQEGDGLLLCVDHSCVGSSDAAKPNESRGEL